jgi:L-alanine-DL-glutamate epimerase-like enolase superfamily enzyme
VFELKIKDIRTATVATGPWPTKVPNDYEWLLVFVETDEGITGIGETRGSLRMERSIEEIRPLIIGEDRTNINRIQFLMDNHPGTFGRSGIDIACWDIVGKDLGVPIYRLMGGRFREKIRMYADSGGPVGWGVGNSEPEAFAKRAKNVLSKGFDAMKLDVDTPRHGQIGFNGCVEEAEIALMERQIGAARDVIDIEMPLAIDCHWKYSPTAAIQIAGRLEKFHLWWLEDPVPFDNVEALVEVKQNTSVPVSAGEHYETRFEFREVIERRAVSMIGPDSITTGGLTEFKKIGEMADLYHIPVAPHNMTSPIATMATAHACAALPNFVALEHHFQDFDWWDSLVKEGPIIRNGYITLPQKPGIGVELNEKEVFKHLRRGSISV